LWIGCRYKKTLVVVSHDRGFLNEVTTDIIHLHDEALHYYRGNFASFEDMYEQRRRAANKEFEKFEKKMKGVQVRLGPPADQRLARGT
jgi:ATP-binding cassette, subfamily F, member 1